MSSSPVLPPISAATNPAAPGAPSAGPVPPPPAGSAEASAAFYPHDATTVVTNDLPASACQHILDLDWRLVDALSGHAVGRRGDRFYARLARPADADEAALEGWGSDEYDAICALAEQLENLWGSRRRRPLVLTPVPPAFRGRRADNDVEAAE